MRGTLRQISQDPKIMAILIACLIIGYIFGNSGDSSHTGHGVTKEGTVWTCSMHPNVRLPEPGICPQCQMDLIPAENGSDDLGPRTMSMSEAAKKLAEIQTVKAERKFVDLKIPLVGMVEYDETRVKTIAAWVPGRLDRLFVDYTGVPVKKGDHLVEMYSPTLYSAQEELIQALKSVKSLEKSTSKYVKQSAKDTVDAAREKLRLFGLKDEQVKAIEKSGKPSATVQINAPTSGIVIHKNAKQGMYVKTGSAIYTVVDLSKVWVKLDAYESDIAWLRYGQEVEVKTEAYGDEVFRGWISFIDPILNQKTRTIKVRVVVENEKGKLRPNMFARATIKARVAANGNVVSKNISNKWVCPMHPEIIKDTQDKCDTCGMDLIKAEEMGYAPATDTTAPLVVPATAVLTTGKRAIVYVKVPDTDRPTYQGIEVTLGPKAGDYYIIRSGIKEGQEVVTRGNFKIDSALQLQAKTSMMNPPKDDAPSKDMHKMPKASHEMKSNPMNIMAIETNYQHYIEIQKALANDDAKTAATAAKKISSKNMPQLKALAKTAKMIAKAKSIQSQRRFFSTLSAEMERLIRKHKVKGISVKRAFCPMAFDNKGGYWLQEDDVLANPYYGASMLRCGSIEETLSTPKSKASE